MVDQRNARIKTFDFVKNTAMQQIELSVGTYNESSTIIMMHDNYGHADQLKAYLESLGYTVNQDYQESTTGHSLKVSW